MQMQMRKMNSILRNDAFKKQRKSKLRIIHIQYSCTAHVQSIMWPNIDAHIVAQFSILSAY